MNISDFVERGNPEDMDDDFQPLEGVESKKSTGAARNKPQKVSLSTKNIIIIVIVLLTSSASFGLGLLAGQGSTGTSANAGGLVVGAVPTTQPSAAMLSAGTLDTSGGSGTLAVSSASSSISASIPEGGEVIGQSSTHMYYLPWCPQAKTISKSDTVWFASEQMAKSAGYAAGPNCPGI